MELIIKHFKYIALLLCIPLMGQENIAGSKTIIKKINQDADISINNKYGKIQLKNWDKDSIKVEISYSYTAKSLEKVNELKKSISFDETFSLSYANISTVFTKSGLDYSVNKILSDRDISIHYKVYIPKSVSVNLTNKFGDIYFNDIKGNVNINLAYGNIQGNNVNGFLQVNLKHGQLNLNTIGQAMIELSHSSNSQIQEAKKVTLKSSFSKLSINKVGLINVNSRKDLLFLKEVSTLNGSSTMSDLHILNLNKSIHLKANLYGHIDIDLIKKSYNDITIQSKNNKVNLAFENKDNVNINLTLKNATAHLPSSFNKLVTAPVDKKTKTIVGTIGTPTNKNITIQIENSTVTLN